MKTKVGQVRRQLLRKNSDQFSQYQCNRVNSFQIQFDGDVISEIPQKDRSYYNLNQDINKINPYPYQPSFEDRSNTKQPEKKIKKQTNAYYPKNVTMNGTCYQKIETNIENQKYKKKIQNIQVICKNCYISQLIPGTASKFYCFSCRKISQSKPKYKFFRCGKCKGKVCYPCGYSKYIKCNNCRTINFVPA